MIRIIVIIPILLIVKQQFVQELSRVNAYGWPGVNGKNSDPSSDLAFIKYSLFTRGLCTSQYYSWVNPSPSAWWMARGKKINRSHTHTHTPTVTHTHNGEG